MSSISALLCFGVDRLAAILALEPFNAAGSINQLLFAGVERMAVGTDFDAQLFLG